MIHHKDLLYEVREHVYASLTINFNKRYKILIDHGIRRLIEVIFSYLPPNKESLLQIPGR